MTESGYVFFEYPTYVGLKEGFAFVVNSFGKAEAVIDVVPAGSVACVSDRLSVFIPRKAILWNLYNISVTDREEQIFRMAEISAMRSAFTCQERVEACLRFCSDRNLEFNHNEIAQVIAMRPETVTRTINRFNIN